MTWAVRWLRRVFTVTPPAWKGNPRWWHHADRVFGYILAFLVVFWAFFDRYLEVFLVICQ